MADVEKKLADLAPPQAGLATRLTNLLALLVFVAFLAVSYRAAHIGDLYLLIDHSANTCTYLSDFLHPDFSDLTKPWDQQAFVPQMWLTIQMALWGTVL